LAIVPREESINLTTIASNTGREHILYRRKSKFKPSQVDESFFGNLRRENIES